MREDGRVRLLRPSQVTLDPSGELPGTVARRVPLGEGMRLEVDVSAGWLVTIAPNPGPSDGERVNMRIAGCVGYPAEGDA